MFKDPNPDITKLWQALFFDLALRKIRKDLKLRSKTGESIFTVCGICLEKLL